MHRTRLTNSKSAFLLRSLRHDAAHSLRRDKLPLVASTGGPGRLDDPLTRTVDAVTEQKYPVLLEYAKASFERIKQRLRHLWALARVKRVPNDYTLASELDHQFGDLPVGLRKILLSMIHGFAGNPRGQLHLHYLDAAPVWGAALGRLLDVIGSSVTDILMLAYRG
jgi:hypothetical protein